MLKNARLKGGLQLVHYPVRSSRFVEVALAIGVGTRHEDRRLMGISHFMEHILFRGCRKMPSSYELNLAFDRIGDGLNALTHKEMTLFTTRVPEESLEEALVLLAEVLAEPLFQGLETEKSIVLEEILEELDDRGRDTDIDNISRRKIFGEHPLGYAILGRPQTLANIKLDDLIAYHRSNYQPFNMVLAVSGGVSWERAWKAASAAFGSSFASRLKQGWPAEPIPAPRPEEIEPFVQFISGADHSSQADVLISFVTPGERSPGELERHLLARVLDDGISSRLQRAMCERQGLLYDISTGIESFTDISLFDIQFSVSPKKIGEVFSLIAKELKGLAEKNVGEEEYEVVRSRFLRDVRHAAESPRAMASQLAEAFLLKLPMPLDPAEFQSAIDAVGARQVRAEARKVFRRANCTVVIKGALNSSERASVGRALRLLG